eukprot:TRINITY_DN1159_c0_g1_i1.p1 TRINITY_DN1159_c0_g1~~TRINITY_DN1159_c0_g1_i1.p1  ORF type:complete len:481 (-),score=105.50 TRINITY_DN1159_c0_g1_i1:545-1807(-)
MGRIDIPLESITSGVEIVDWYTLKTDEELHPGEDVSGQIKIKLLYHSEDRTISRDDFEIIKKIGEGSFAKVFLVKKKDSGTLYAMKSIKKKMLIRENELHHTRTELQILRNNDSPFLINLRYSFQTDARVYFVFRYVAGGELFYHLNKQRKFSADFVRFYAAEVIMGLGYLHKMGVIYRDLKPENCLLEETGHVLLADFGLAKNLASVSGKTNTMCGTPEYLAPEVVLGKKYGKDIDWWALGNFMFELFTSRPPFTDDDEDELNAKIVKGQPKFPTYIPDDAKDLIVKLLALDPKKRLGHGRADDSAVKAHPFFKSIDWDKLAKLEVTPPLIPKATHSNVAFVDPTFLKQPAKESISSAPEDLTESQNDVFKDFNYIGEESGKMDTARKTPVKPKKGSKLKVVRNKADTKKNSHKKGSAT